MTTWMMIVLLIGVLLTAGAVAWTALHSNRPEDGSSNSSLFGGATAADGAPTTESGEYYKGADRPAGPDAEVMNPDLLGGDQSPPE